MQDKNKEKNIFDNGVSVEDYHKKIKKQRINWEEENKQKSIDGNTYNHNQNLNNIKDFLNENKLYKENLSEFKGYGKSYELCAKILFVFCFINLIVSIVLLCVFQDYKFLIDALITCMTWAFTIYCLNGISVSHDRIDKLEEKIEQIYKDKDKNHLN